MPLNKTKGEMYPWATHTWNPIKGKCPLDCIYCHLKKWGKQNPIRLDEKDLNTDLGSGKKIFVGSSTDMWAKDVPDEWKFKVLEKCREYDNEYIFQTKNWILWGDMPEKTLIGITLESNRFYRNLYGGITVEDFSNRLDLFFNSDFPAEIRPAGYKMRRKFISIEPILDFDLEDFLLYIKLAQPLEFVSIGADSMGHHLPEPSWDKIKALVREIKEMDVTVLLKKNLRRLKKTER